MVKVSHIPYEILLPCQQHPLFVCHGSNVGIRLTPRNRLYGESNRLPYRTGFPYFLCTQKASNPEGKWPPLMRNLTQVNAFRTFVLLLLLSHLCLDLPSDLFLLDIPTKRLCSSSVSSACCTPCSCYLLDYIILMIVGEKKIYGTVWKQFLIHWSRLFP
jgi:hypothetical protein